MPSRTRAALKNPISQPHPQLKEGWQCCFYVLKELVAGADNSCKMSAVAPAGELAVADLGVSIGNNSKFSEPMLFYLYFASD